MIVQGVLSPLIKGLKDPKALIGKPVTLNGIEEIGTIIEIDKEKDIFFAEIDNGLIGSVLLGSYDSSFS